MEIPRAPFFDHVRSRLFGGHMDQGQVEGITVLLDHGAKLDARWLAYILATTYHETARTMQPIREVGLGKGLRYGNVDPETGQTYYGRGYVQLTHRANYDRMSVELGVDLTRHPDLALEPDIACRILFAGMIKGLFTGRRLVDYMPPGKADWINARRIINGLDRATAIAGYAIQFDLALEPMVS